MSNSSPMSLPMPILVCSKAPTLQEILSDTAPPPWTLSAFMAYLSQNHCLETLEFTMEAERYREVYAQLAQAQTASPYAIDERLCSLWHKLIQAYIMPCGSREVNLPAPVRDRLLLLPCHSSPPAPSELDESITIVYELMNDSVLVPFLASMAPLQADYAVEDDQDARISRWRSRQTEDDESSRPPKAFFPALGGGRRNEGQSRSISSSSTEAVDRADLLDDRGSHSSPSLEPMTPPTTPPTSDWGFPSPPGSLQRAISAHNSGWKKMGAKLGLGKKGRTSPPSNPGQDAYHSDTAGDPSSRPAPL